MIKANKTKKKMTKFGAQKDELKVQHQALESMLNEHFKPVREILLNYNLMRRNVERLLVKQGLQPFIFKPKTNSKLKKRVKLRPN